MTATARAIAAVFGVALSFPASAAIFDTTIADVTARAFSVVWASSEPLIDSSKATVSVFEDFNSDGIPDGPDINSSLVVVVESPENALDNGIIKVDVQGVRAARNYLVRTSTTTASGSLSYPTPGGAPLTVRTAARTMKTTPGNTLIANDLLIREARRIDGTDPAPGSMLVVASVPTISSYPLSAFIGDDTGASAALVDLNNMIDSRTGGNAQSLDGAVVTFTVYRGLLCPDLKHHLLKQSRLIPAQNQLPRFTRASTPQQCFLQNPNCDAIIDIADAQLIFDAYLVADGTCQFNSDLDFNGDGIVDIVDTQQVYDRYLKTAPFE